MTEGRLGVGQTHAHTRLIHPLGQGGDRPEAGPQERQPPVKGGLVPAGVLIVSQALVHQGNGAEAQQPPEQLLRGHLVDESEWLSQRGRNTKRNSYCRRLAWQHRLVDRWRNGLTLYFGYPESPRPKTANRRRVRESEARLLRSMNLQKCLALSGNSPWPVVETTKMTPADFSQGREWTSYVSIGMILGVNSSFLASRPIRSATS